MRHVVITGGTRGLGLGIVKSLLTQGYRVSTCGRKETPDLQLLLTESPHNLFWSACRVDDERQVERFFHDAVEWAGDDGLYGLVNNAGVAREGILATFPVTETRRIIETNLIGALNCARAALRHMISNSVGGRIVNISSIIGSRGYTGLAAYSASKAGLDGLTRSLAREVGRRQITVNSVAPGYMVTDMSASLSREQIGQIVRRTPLGKLATVRDVVSLIDFLLSDAAACITGQTIVVDGGISV
jgi:3-oxoacyl-[acyl-carrier protein] reductase